MRKHSKRLSVVISEADRQLLNSYCAFCSCISTYLGKAYEVVVHSFGESDNFTISVFNPSGRIPMERKVNTANGSIEKASDAALGTVEQLHAKLKHGEDPITVGFGIGEDGKTYKSASIGILGSAGNLIGMICVNCCLDVPFSEILRTFAIPSYLDTMTLPFTMPDPNSRYETSLAQTITSIRDKVMNDPTVPAKFKRKEIVRLLNEMGVFKIKNAIQISADALGITIATIYMHIRNLEE